MAQSRLTAALIISVALPLPVMAQGGPDQPILLDPIVIKARDDDGNAADRGTSEYVAAGPSARSRRDHE